MIVEPSEVVPGYEYRSVLPVRAAHYRVQHPDSPILSNANASAVGLGMLVPPFGGQKVGDLRKTSRARVACKAISRNDLLPARCIADLLDSSHRIVEVVALAVIAPGDSGPIEFRKDRADVEAGRNFFIEIVDSLDLRLAFPTSQARVLGETKEHLRWVLAMHRIAVLQWILVRYDPARTRRHREGVLGKRRAVHRREH